MLRILANMAPSMAASISASSNTMNGALPPSSIAGLTILSAASCKSLRPTSVEPVNDTTRTRGSCSIAPTTLPEEREGMTLTTPAGTPASSRIGISASMVSGVSEAGLTTTGQPAASAGPILRVAIAAGKFHGVTSTAMPAGLWCTTIRAPEEGARQRADVTHCFLGVPAEELGGIGDFAARVRQCLAVLDGDQFRQPFGVAHDQLECLAQNFAALARLPGGPAGERRRGGVERGVGVFYSSAGDGGDLVFGRRVDHVEACAVGRFFPFAADPQIGRHIGEEIVIPGSHVRSSLRTRFTVFQFDENVPVGLAA